MSVRVRLLLPSVLTTTSGGRSRLDVELAEPATLGAALDVLAERYPALERRLRDEQARLRRYVNFFIDGEECRYLGGANTPVHDGAEIQVIPSVAGG
jgi:molybdopterin converting factor small subunit